MTQGGNDLGDRLMTAAETALYLGYSEGTVRNKASAGEIPFVKLGAALRFRRTEIDAWIEAHDIRAKADIAARRASEAEMVEASASGSAVPS